MEDRTHNQGTKGIITMRGRREGLGDVDKLLDWSSEGTETDPTDTAPANKLSQRQYKDITLFSRASNYPCTE